MPAATGNDHTPASSALKPCTFCRYCVVKKRTPKRLKKARVIAPLAALKRRLANRRTSSIGASGRSSHAADSARIAAGGPQGGGVGARGPPRGGGPVMRP